MSNDAERILAKHREEERRSAMAKRMAEEAERRNDFNVKNWHGDPRSIYQFSMKSWEWKNMGLGRKIFVSLAGGIIAVIFIIFILAQSGLIRL